MKKILFIFALFAGVSCSNDDDNNSTPIVPTTTPMATKVTMDGDPGDNLDRVYVFTYDSNKRITQAVVTGDVNRTYAISYNSDNLPATITITGDLPGVQTITYDSDERIATSTIGGVTSTFSYNSATDIFTVDSLPFGFNSVGDVRFFNELAFNYDNSKKGPMANSAMSYHLLAIILDNGFFYFGSRKPVTTLKTGDVSTYTFTNSYNASGYLTHSEVTGLDNVILDVEYTAM